MQLKPQEQTETKEDNVQSSITPQDNRVSNNGYFNPEHEFDFEGDGIFGKAQSMNTPSVSTDNDNSYYDNPGYDSYSTNNYGGPSNTVDGYNPDNHPRKLSKKEFYESPRNRKNRDRIIISSIVIIVCAIGDWIKTNFMVQMFKPKIDKLNELTGSLGMGSEFTIDVDAIMRAQIITSVFLIALGVGIFILKSRACALTGLIFTIVNMLYMIVTAHKFAGYYSLIAFGYATVATFAAYSAWQEYEQKGDWKKEW